MASEPEALVPILLLGKTLYELGRLKAAQGVFRRGRQLFPEHPELQRLSMLVESTGEARAFGDPFAPTSAPSLIIRTEDFSVPDVLDFLANQRASGLFVVEAGDREGTLILHEGRFVAARVPDVAPLSSWFEAAGREGDFEASAFQEAVLRQGVAAVLAFLGWPLEEVRFYRGDASAHPSKNQDAAVEVRALLMETLRQWDESLASPPVLNDSN